MKNSILKINRLLLFIFIFSTSISCSNKTINEVTEEVAENSFLIDLKEYGAAGDGFNDDTSIINNAISECDSNGGGTILFPEGIYLSSSIRLVSNITIDLDSGASIKSNSGGFNVWEDNPFDEGVMDRAYYHIQASMFWGEDLENIKFRGAGIIDAGGLTKSSNVKDGEGDKVIALRNCKNIEITGVNFTHTREGGAHYVILLTGCDGVLIDGVKIKAQRDGINLMNSRNVNITNTNINSIRYEGTQEKGGDDAIKIGSDYSLGEIRPVENIRVSDCTIAAGCNGIMFGTETLGPISNCTFENIEINFAGKNALGITSNDGSFISNLTFKNITIKKVLSPFFIKISDVKRVPESLSYSTGKIENILFENITATDIENPIRGEMSNLVWGKPNSAIQDIEFRNVAIIVKGGQPLSAAKIDPPENDERFPQKVISDIIHGPLPAYGYYLRHVRNVQFYNCSNAFEKEDARPAFIIDDGEKIGLTEVTMEKGDGAECYVEIRNSVNELLIHNCLGLPEVNESVSNRMY